MKNQEEREIYIYGAGKYGRCAAEYFSSQTIIGFLDRDLEKIGTKIKGIPVYSVERLKEKQALVVIAVANEQEKIKKLLFHEYGITDFLIFSISNNSEKVHYLDVDSNQLIIAFKSGLGNQMFQYALYSFLSRRGRKCRADLSSYVFGSEAEFSLTDVFRYISLTECDSSERDRYFQQGLLGDKSHYYIEPYYLYWNNTDDSIVTMKSGYIEGYHQTYKYAAEIESSLRKDFSFPVVDDKKMKSIISHIKSSNSVSIHVRRGDYMSKGNESIFGGICTSEYYKDAISYINNKVNSPYYVFLSDDIDWVKDNMYLKNAIYISQEMFEDYKDWYDMYIMSMCKHNIIANSTFSWWGAWLNNNADKIVISPQKWLNGYNNIDVCPPEWIRI